MFKDQDTWHRDIPDPTDPNETFDQERQRVRPFVPKHLVDIWEGLCHDDSAGPGWPEFMAQMLALKPKDVMAIMSALGIIHCQRTGASLLKIESSGIVVCAAVLEGKPFLAGIYRMAKMSAVMNVADLKNNPAMTPYVGRIIALIEQADQATHDLADASFVAADKETATKWSTRAVNLMHAMNAVKELLNGTAPAVEPPNVPEPEPEGCQPHPIQGVDINGLRSEMEGGKGE